jgi:phage host-nuclease inhibitor protein Gam
MEIKDTETLDAAVADVVRLKLELATVTAEMETTIANIQKRYAGRIGKMADRISEREDEVAQYCEMNRSVLFPEKKSRDTLTAVIGFEFGNWSVATANRKIKWKDVVSRLKRVAWGGDYLTIPEPEVSKTALLADRAKLTAVQKLAAGITFEQDETFYIRPKSEIAEATTREAA